MRKSFAPRLEQLETRLTPSGPYYPDQTTYTYDPSTANLSGADAVYSSIKVDPVLVAVAPAPVLPPYVY